MSAQDIRPTESLPSAAEKALEKAFQERVRPLLAKHCVRCHNEEKMKSGIRLDHLDGSLPERSLRLWEAIQELVAEEEMPPSKEPQPTADQRQILGAWIDEALAFARARQREKNGSVRRLTVPQYRNTLRDLLGIDDDLTDVLPPDGISRDGFANNGETLLLSPLLVEKFFDIAERALDLCLVDEASKPAIQSFRVDLGQGVNPTPCPDKLILGASSLLLANDELLVTELTPTKPFAYNPIAMRTRYRFIEGYQGNATVRGWREYDSIYHAVFAGIRGHEGYPKGLAYGTVPEGLLLRPAIPSAEVFAVESTYGPRANFKISLRELPDHGRFRVTVRAAKYDDGLLLDPGAETRPDGVEGAITVSEPNTPRPVDVDRAGLYQIDVFLKPLAELAPPDTSRLREKLIGAWTMDGDARGQSGEQGPGDRPDGHLDGRLVGETKFVDSPFGQAVSIDGLSGAVVIPRHDSMNVADGDFTVAAWIHPRELKSGGIVSLGGYSYKHGWLVDMNGSGMFRIETSKPANFPNGTVNSPTGVIHAGRWQHIAIVVRRGDDNTRLYVNGVEVATGTVEAANLDNPETELHIGRVANAAIFSGEIDEVRIYRRALGVAELAALVEPGREFAQPPPEGPKTLSVQLGERHFSGTMEQEAFLVVRLPAGALNVTAHSDGREAVDRVVLSPLGSGPLTRRFERFEKRLPRVGVHVGVRRDCGSTFQAVGAPQVVATTALGEFVFEGAINNYPRPEVEEDNVNYLAGIREIGVRSEYTDSRDMPRLLIRSVEFEGPLYESWPPATHRRIFIDSNHRHEPAVYAREVIRAFADRAFRRPATDVEVASFIDVWADSFAESENFQRSVRDALVLVLTSPQFLFLIENSKSPEPEPLGPYELASKLSYFLWNTMPDARLLQLAVEERIEESLDIELERMIADSRFRQFATEFTSRWLGLEKLDVVEVDHKRYPRLTRDVKVALRDEPVEFVMHLIRQDLPLSNLLQSDFILANEISASYYGLGERTESGFEFRPLRHEQASLGGLLSHAGILAGLSDGRESNPVKRGAWLARKIIAEPPDDPPPNVPELPEDDGAHLTLREKLERHRDQDGCAKCHSGIDPWGLPLEQFDAGGLVKTGTEVDARSTLPDGTEITGTDTLKAYLADERLEQVAFSVLKHLATYATGRSLGYNELGLLKTKTKGLELKRGGYRMRELLGFVVRSELFREK